MSNTCILVGHAPNSYIPVRLSQIYYLLSTPCSQVLYDTCSYLSWPTAFRRADLAPQVGIYFLRENLTHLWINLFNLWSVKFWHRSIGDWNEILNLVFFRRQTAVETDYKIINHLDAKLMAILTSTQTMEQPIKVSFSLTYLTSSGFRRNSYFNISLTCLDWPMHPLHRWVFLY